MHIPSKFKHFFDAPSTGPSIKRMNKKPHRHFTSYTEIDLNRYNKHIQSILQSNFPTIVLKSHLSSAMSTTGERLICQIDWKATPFYKGSEVHLEGNLMEARESLQVYISRRLKLKRKVKLEFYQALE